MSEQEYQVKSNPQTMPPPLSAYLKWENTHKTRQMVDAPKGTKMGTFVDYPVRGKKYIALSDEKDGKVMIQPHNCVIDLSLITESAINAARTSLAAMKSEDNAFGIVYQGTPSK